MANNVCEHCGAPLELNSKFCKYCGGAISITNSVPVQNQQQPVVQQPVYQQPAPQQPMAQNTYNQQAARIRKEPVKSKVAAGILGILLGGFGIHKFYLGKVVQGIIYLLFCWTYIPAIIGFIEGIVYLASDDQKWLEKVGYREIRY